MDDDNSKLTLADVVLPRTEKVMPSDYPNEPYLGLDDIEAHTTKRLGSKLSSSMKSSAKRFYKGDVLYSRLRPYLNKVWSADQSGLCSAEFIVLPQNNWVDAEFLKHRLNARDFVTFANSLNAGDRPRVDFDQISPFHFPEFSVEQQKRIVEKIEELFSEIDAGVASLQRARDQLGVYRQALLKKAFTGELTAQWRQDNPDQIEPAEKLLERIRQEREARYRQQVDDWKSAVEEWEARGKEGKKPAKPRKPKEIEPVKEASIPTDWIAFSYGELCSIVRNGLSAKPSGNSGHKIARISAVRPMFFDYEDYRFLACDEEVAENYALRTDDLLFTRYNGSRRYVGVCARYVQKDLRLFPDKLIQTRPNLPSLYAQYLELALNSGCSRAFIETKIRTTAGQSGISGGDIKFTPVAICSLAEQKEIVRLLEAQFEAIEQNEREIDAALIRAEALRQSIFKKAFSGQLVEQDPKDESASVLLERIVSEREAAEVKKPKKKAAKSLPSTRSNSNSK